MQKKGVVVFELCLLLLIILWASTLFDIYIKSQKLIKSKETDIEEEIIDLSE